MSIPRMAKSPVLDAIRPTQDSSCKAYEDYIRLALNFSNYFAAKPHFRGA
jgi:hypothetical protein